MIINHPNQGSAEIMSNQYEYKAPRNIKILYLFMSAILLFQKKIETD